MCRTGGWNQPQQPDQHPQSAWGPGPGSQGPPPSRDLPLQSAPAAAPAPAWGGSSHGPPRQVACQVAFSCVAGFMQDQNLLHSSTHKVWNAVLVLSTMVASCIEYAHSYTPESSPIYNCNGIRAFQSTAVLAVYTSCHYLHKALGYRMAKLSILPCIKNKSNDRLSVKVKSTAC